MSDFLAQVERHMRERIPLPTRVRILVAVSGGVDSSVLLHTLNQLSRSKNWELVVAHFDHQLRGAESDQDATHVQLLAHQMGLPFVSGKPSKILAKTEPGSIEMQARTARHQFLTAQARERDCNFIAVGHHAQDQAELVLLRLIRGTGSEGLGGMHWLEPHFLDPTITLIRPFLGCSRAALEAEAKRLQLTVRIDPTNFNRLFLRNQVRLEVLPLLMSLNPRLIEHLSQTAELLTAESDFLRSTAADWAKRRPKAFASLPIAVQRECLKRELIRLGVVPDFFRIETLRLSPGKVLTLSRQLRVVHSGDGNVIPAGPTRPHRPVWRTDRRAHSLAAEKGVINFGGLRVDWEVEGPKSPLPPPLTAPSTEGFELFDADQLGEEITLRFWQAGDRFQPIGLPAASKLQNLFVNNRVSPEARPDRVVAVRGDGSIIWVEGLRMGEIVKTTAQTQRVLRWQWKRQQAPPER